MDFRSICGDDTRSAITAGVKLDSVTERTSANARAPHTDPDTFASPFTFVSHSTIFQWWGPEFIALRIPHWTLFSKDIAFAFDLLCRTTPSRPVPGAFSTPSCCPPFERSRVQVPSDLNQGHWSVGLLEACEVCQR